MDPNLDPIYQEFYNNSQNSMDMIFQMSTLLGTGLSSEQLHLVVEMLNYGANSEELAKLIQNLRRESSVRQNTINRLFRSQSRPDLS